MTVVNIFLAQFFFFYRESAVGKENHVQRAVSKDATIGRKSKRITTQAIKDITD